MYLQPLRSYNLKYLALYFWILYLIYGNTLCLVPSVHIRGVILTLAMHCKTVFVWASFLHPISYSHTTKNELSCPSSPIPCLPSKSSLNHSLPAATPALKPHSLLLIQRPFLLLQFHLQVPIFRLQLLDPKLQTGHLLFGTNAEFLDDLEEAPETEDDNEGSNFLEDAV